MVKTFNKKYLLIFFPFLFNCVIYSAGIIQGDSQNPQQSFNQPLSVWAMDRLGDFFYVGARTAGAKSYALAFLPREKNEFFGLTQQKVFINGTENTNNPLYNAPIRLLTLLGQYYRPVVVPDNDPSKAYFIDNFTDKRIDVLQTAGIITTEEKVTNGIIGLASNNSERGGYVCAAVQNNNGDSFGEPGSGIALLMAYFVKEGEKEFFRFNQISVSAFDKSTPQIQIGSDVTFTSTAIDMHWDNYLGLLYIALQLQAGAGANDGVKALVIGTVNNNLILFRAIGPDSLFNGTNKDKKIVGAVGANIEVSLHKVRTMLTSTSLQYVIVLGGNVGVVNTKRSVFALPLVNDPNNPDIHGTLAKKDALPEDRFSDQEPYSFMSRGFRVAATASDDAVINTDIPARVGGGELTIGDIDDLFVKDDAVFAVVSNADTGQRPGVFYSRALFDQYGRIKAWTEWQRVSGSVEDSVFGSALDATTANMILLTGQDKDSINTVKRTFWGQGDNNGLGPLANVFNGAFPRDRGGIHGLFDMPATTTGLDDISLLIATGCQTVALVQTSTTNGSFVPTVGEIFETNKEVFINGTIDRDLSTADARVLIISGGALNSIGFINAAEIGQAGTQAWLFVGGDKGLAVLKRADGAGWDSPPGLGSGFSGLQQGTGFSLIGSYKHVRKLVYDDNFLYVLTDTKLDRIDLLQSNFATNVLVITTIAASEVNFTAQTTLFDLIVSEKFALLATSDGLFRIGNGLDIRTVTSGGGWRFVTIPEGCVPIIQLLALSKTGREQDVARFEGGTVYALVSFIGKNRAQVNRFSVQPVIGSQVNDQTISPLPDLFVKDIPSYFVSFGQFRDWIISDGALFFHEINRYLCDAPVIYLLGPGARSGLRFLADKNPSLPITMSEACFLLPLLRNSATGSWLLAGNEGLKINE
ncbi:hypothetical protein E3J79_00700 [Candidatus Dependentiae bacterium]|nr:MAG: hypothetical protein E3J79_00700 [Candidatus Dependentiae bacterium]